MRANTRDWERVGWGSWSGASACAFAYGVAWGCACLVTSVGRSARIPVRKSDTAQLEDVRLVARGWGGCDCGLLIVAMLDALRSRCDCEDAPSASRPNA